MATTEEMVLKFLKSFKDLMTNGKRPLDFVPRAENNQTIIDLGLTTKNVEDEILGLTMLDYCSGPEKDHSRPGVIWEFGKRIQGCEVYIKL